MWGVTNAVGVLSARLGLFLAAFFFSFAAHAGDTSFAERDPWSVTVYAGPSTDKYFGAVFTSGNMHPTSVLFGATINRRLLYLGHDIWLGSEAQIAQYWFGHHDTEFGAGPGLLINEPFGIPRTALSFYDGPSWDTDPADKAVGYGNKVFNAQRQQFLNYIDIEYAVALSPTGKWDGVFRFFHRSGMFGVYSVGDDAGLAFGLGVRYRF